MAEVEGLEDGGFDDDESEEAYKPPSLVMKPHEELQVLQATRSAQELDPRLRSRLHKGIVGSAGSRILAAWQRCGADATGRLELLFLQAWARDPSLGILRIRERTVHETAQNRTVVLGWFTMFQLEQKFGREDALKLAASAYQDASHLQDSSIKWFQCVDEVHSTQRPAGRPRFFLGKS